MNQVEQAQKNMIKPVVERLYKEFLYSNQFTKLSESESFSDYEKETIIIVSVYEKLQMYFISRDINRILAISNVSEQKSELHEILRTIYSHETELFKATRIIDKDEQTLAYTDGFYSMVSNEKIAMFEVIEEVIQKGV